MPVSARKTEDLMRGVPSMSEEIEMFVEEICGDTYLRHKSKCKWI